jgi:hypothetical protein
MKWRVLAFRGATAYECQVWRVYIRVTHLRGAYWRYRPWRRVEFGFDKH